MKKLILIALVTFGMLSCTNSEKSECCKTDSTCVKTDTTITVVDTVAVKGDSITTDTTMSK